MEDKEKKILSKRAYRKEVEKVIKVEHLVVKQQRPWTCVMALVSVAGVGTEIIGFSKVTWPDVFDSNKGEEIALAKAKADFAKRIVNGQVAGLYHMGWNRSISDGISPLVHIAGL